MLFFFFMVVGLFFMVLGVFNYVVWWGMFIVMDLVFVFIGKKLSSYGGLLNYFVFQESLALLFLVVFLGVVQGVVVMTKMGLAPFHYWLFVVVGGLESWLFMWFLTFQKLPFMGVLMVVMVVELVFLVVLGFFLCYFQLLLLKDYKLMLMINSTESFGWILLGYVFFLWGGMFLFVYYFFLSLFLIPVFGGEKLLDYEWLVLLMYVNIPLGVLFFVKVYVVSFVFSSFFVWMIGVLFFMFINFFSLMVWLLGKSVEEGFFVGKMSVFFYLVLG
nr:NADH dehydrogenase subunit 2 [Aspiculuris sp. PC-2022]